MDPINPTFKLVLIKNKLPLLPEEKIKVYPLTSLWNGETK
jgi:hypothetical protein